MIRLGKGLPLWGDNDEAVELLRSDDRLKALSPAGNPLEQLSKLIDFEVFRADLEEALARRDPAKGGWPPYDAVLMFKMLVLPTLDTLSDDQTEYPIKDRLSFMRFVGLEPYGRVPDAKRSGCSARPWPGPAPSRVVRAVRCDAADQGLVWRLVVRSWTRPGSRPVGRDSPRRRRRGSRAAVRRTTGGARRAQINRDRRWTIRRGRKQDTPPDQAKRQATPRIPSTGGADVSHRGHCRPIA